MFRYPLFAMAGVLLFLILFSSQSTAGLHNGGFENNDFGKLTEVNAETSSITIKNEESDKLQTFQLGEQTLVIIDGKERAVKDLKVGARLKITTFTRVEPFREPPVVTTVKALPRKSRAKKP